MARITKADPLALEREIGVPPGLGVAGITVTTVDRQVDHEKRVVHRNLVRNWLVGKGVLSEYARALNRVQLAIIYNEPLALSDVLRSMARPVKPRASPGKSERASASGNLAMRCPRCGAQLTLLAR